MLWCTSMPMLTWRSYLSPASSWTPTLRLRPRTDGSSRQACYFTNICLQKNNRPHVLIPPATGLSQQEETRLSCCCVTWCGILQIGRAAAFPSTGQGEWTVCAGVPRGAPKPAAAGVGHAAAPERAGHLRPRELLRAPGQSQPGFLRGRPRAAAAAACARLRRGALICRGGLYGHFGGRLTGTGAAILHKHVLECDAECCLLS